MTMFKSAALVAGAVLMALTLSGCFFGGHNVANPPTHFGHL